MGRRKKRKNKIGGRDAELRVMLAAGRYFLNTDDLHFGYWPEGLPQTLASIPEAQERHSQMIIAKIPEGAKRILDVGCGIGNMSKRLIDLGHKVEGLSPSPYLNARARQLLGPDYKIYECKVEDFETDGKKYDLILFSESFQYVDTGPALDKVLSLLDVGGHLLICDFFRTPHVGRSPLSGGPKLTVLREMIAERPFEMLDDINITKETAPMMQLVDDGVQQVAKPLYELVHEEAQTKKPFLYKLVVKIFGKKLARFESRYLSGTSDGANFMLFKSYRLMLFRKIAGPHNDRITGRAHSSHRDDASEPSQSYTGAALGRSRLISRRISWTIASAPRLRPSGM